MTRHDERGVRHDARKGLVIEETNAIDKVWLRAGFLDEPSRADVRGLLRSYVDVRVIAAAGEVDLGEAARQSEALLDRMWASRWRSDARTPTRSPPGFSSSR